MSYFKLALIATALGVGSAAFVTGAPLLAVTVVLSAGCLPVLRAVGRAKRARS